jgi:hypothetical protein
MRPPRDPRRGIFAIFFVMLLLFVAQGIVTKGAVGISTIQKSP